MQEAGLVIEEAELTRALPEINSIKNKMSKAYMHGLNSTVNYIFQEPNQDFDGAGIDLQIINKTVGTSRKVASESNQINVQLKGVSITSTTMLRVTSDGIEYNLKDDLYAVGGAHFLIVVVLPDDKDIVSWRTIDDSQLILKAYAYYTKIDYMIKKGWVNITNMNILTEESYISLFDVANNKDAI